MRKIPWHQSKSFTNRGVRVLVYLVLSSSSVLFLMPFAWMLSTSLKTPAQAFVFPPQWIPDPIMWGNYKEALSILPFSRYFMNTGIIVVASVTGLVLSSTLVGYAFARLRAPGHNVLFLVLLSVMMLPQQVTLIPIFIVFRKLQMVGTFWPLILPSWLGLPFDVFLVRQFLMTIPHELDDAAKIDGCGYFAIYWRILLPLAKPPVMTIAILHFMFKYNEFMAPLIYLSNMDRFTVSLGLALFQGKYLVAWNLLMAATLVSLVPCLLLFFVVQRYFIQGIVITGVKG